MIFLKIPGGRMAHLMMISRFNDSILNHTKYLVTSEEADDYLYPKIKLLKMKAKDYKRSCGSCTGQSI